MPRKEKKPRARSKTVGGKLVRKKRTFKSAARMIQVEKAAEVAFAGTANGDERVHVPAVPRPPISLLYPVLFALGVGCAGLFLIYGLAASLGPENTKLWLLSAASSFGMKMFIIQPMRVCLAVLLMKCADAFRSDTLERITGALANVES